MGRRRGQPGRGDQDHAPQPAPADRADSRGRAPGRAHRRVERRAAPSLARGRCGAGARRELAERGPAGPRRSRPMRSPSSTPASPASPRCTTWSPATQPVLSPHRRAIRIRSAICASCSGCEMCRHFYGAGPWDDLGAAPGVHRIRRPRDQPTARIAQDSIGAARCRGAELVRSTRRCRPSAAAAARAHRARARQPGRARGARTPDRPGAVHVDALALDRAAAHPRPDRPAARRTQPERGVDPRLQSSRCSASAALCRRPDRAGHIDKEQPWPSDPNRASS